LDAFEIDYRGKLGNFFVVSVFMPFVPFMFVASREFAMGYITNVIVTGAGISDWLVSIA
jgi:hypothetical protein